MEQNSLQDFTDKEGNFIKKTPISWFYPLPHQHTHMHRAMCISLARITCVQQEAHGITPSWPHCISWAPPDFWMHLLYHLAVDTTILCSQSCLIPQEFQAKLSLLLFLSGYSTAPVLLVIIPHLISKSSVCSLSSGYLCETHGVALQQLIHATPLTLHLLFF